MLPWDALSEDSQRWFIKRAERLQAGVSLRTVKRGADPVSFTRAQAAESVRGVRFARLKEALGFPPPYVPVIKDDK